MTRNSAIITVLAMTLWLCSSTAGMAQDVLDAPVETREIERISIDGLAKMPLRLEERVSSGTAHKGDPVRFILLRDLVVDGKVVMPSGAAFSATVSRVRPKTPERSGSVKLAKPSLVLGNGMRVQLEKDNPEEKAGLTSIPFYTVGAITIGPLVLATAPIWIPELVIHDIREQRLKSKAHRSKPEPVDQEFSEGDVFIYYADIHSLTRKLRRANQRLGGARPTQSQTSAPEN